MTPPHVFNVMFERMSGTRMTRMINANNSREARERIKMSYTDLKKIISVVKVRQEKKMNEEKLVEREMNETLKEVKKSIKQTDKELRYAEKEIKRAEKESEKSVKGLED